MNIFEFDVNLGDMSFTSYRVLLGPKWGSSLGSPFVAWTSQGAKLVRFSKVTRAIRIISWGPWQGPLLTVMSGSWCDLGEACHNRVPWRLRQAKKPVYSFD